uniref:Ribulose-1,5-bisphosphate carboxylase/oxygenase large subunit n=1 Tax=Meloidogyne hapla TaxID=6305 RepID=A0A1I8BGS1_MELHA
SILSTFANASSNSAISDYRQGIDTHICNYM